MSKIQRKLIIWPALLASMITACTPAKPDLTTQSTEYLNTWFNLVRTSPQPDTMCHGLGMLKHDEFSCADILDHAARVMESSRNLLQIKERDCFAKVCGEFVEASYVSTDLAGNPNEENIVLKRDADRVQVYWYRSTTLLDAYRQANPELPAEDEQDPLQAAYDEITATHPELYQYPPCYGVRASTANLRTDRMPQDNIDPVQMVAAAEQCGASFCFTLVGQKIAGLCPDG